MSSRLGMTAIRLERAPLAAAAHRKEATANDAVLLAVGAALHQMLLSRGESVEPIAITVPVSGRGSGPGPAVGNLVTPMLVEIPTSGAVRERLAQVEAAVRAHKAAATGPPPIAIMGGLFRVVARLGGYRFYMNHQRRFHTLVTHVRGPEEPLTIDGRLVREAIPVAIGERGNITVSFEVLSYAGGSPIRRPDTSPGSPPSASAAWGRGTDPPLNSQLLGVNFTKREAEEPRIR